MASGIRSVDAVYGLQLTYHYRSGGVESIRMSPFVSIKRSTQVDRLKKWGFVYRKGGWQDGTIRAKVLRLSLHPDDSLFRKVD